MSHEPGKRGWADRLIDTLQLKIEEGIREQGGSVAFLVPGLGHLLALAVQTVGPERFRDLALYGGGFLELPRRIFPIGQTGDKAHRLANNAFNEFFKSLAATPGKLSSTEVGSRFDAILAQLGISTKDAKGGATMEGEQVVVVVPRANPDQAQAHHPSCVAIPPRTILDQWQDRQGRQQSREKPNPAYTFLAIPRSDAEAQGVNKHADCFQIFETAASAKKKSAPKKERPLAILQQLDPAEKNEFNVWLQGLAPDQRTRLFHELEQRLTSVEELKGLLAVPRAQRYEAVIMFTDRFQERAEEAGNWALGQARSGVAELRAATQAAAQTVEDTTQRLRAWHQRLKARLP